jgi:hypothetical protein
MEAVAADFEAILGTAICYRDPWITEFGLENVMMAIGDTFLEILSPIREDTTAGRYLERRGGDAGYMVVLQVDDLAKTKERVKELGLRVVNVTDRPALKGVHLHPRDIGGAIVALNIAIPPGSWEGAGEWDEWMKYVSTDVTTTITAVELGALDPRALAERWASVLERPIQEESGTLLIELDQGSCRFVRQEDESRQGVIGFDVAAHDPTEVLSRASERGYSVRANGFDLAGVAVRVVQG